MASFQLTVIALSLCVYGCLSSPVAQDGKPSDRHSNPVSEVSKNALQPAQVARYIVHKTDWLSIGSISSQKTSEGYPAVEVKSFTDGPDNNSTGIPYLYMTDWDSAAKDFKLDNRAGILVTLASTGYCQTRNYDTQDPRCPKVFLTGKYVDVDKNSEEYTFARDALIERHPVMKDWPESHGFHVTKVVPTQIAVFYKLLGGRDPVKTEDYFSTEVTNLINSGANLETILKD